MFLTYQYHVYSLLKKIQYEIGIGYYYQYYRISLYNVIYFKEASKNTNEKSVSWSMVLSDRYRTTR